MQSVDEPVVYLEREAEHVPLALAMIFAPDNARDGVVSVKIALIGQRRERDPRQTAEIDQRVALGCSGEKLRLRPALGACRAAEVLQRVTGRHRHDVELFRTGVQVGEARFTACEQDRLAVSDGISECGRVIDRLRAQPDQSVIKGQAAPFRESMQCRDVRGDGHAVKRIRQAGEERVCLAPRSGIERDGGCETALSLAQDYDEKVQVVNNQRISVTQEQSVYDAIKLRDEGKSAAEIRQVLEKEKMQASIYITVDTLKYLKKGGRITPAAAAIGTVLNLKPVLQIQGEKLDAFAKVRGWKAAKKTMLNAIEKDLTDRFADVKDQMVLGMAYTCSKEEADEWKNEIQTRFPDYELVEGPLSLSIACHIGPGAMAITCMKRV